MNGTPTVSVIIPGYNAGKFIEQAINSVLAQTYPKIEVVVVNDGSSDDTRQKVKPYLDFGNLKYIEQQNKGVARARNVGIVNSTGKLITFLDHDDWWLPKKIERQVGFIMANPNIPWVHTNVQAYFNGSSEKVYWQKGVKGNSFKDLFARNQIVLSTVLVRRDCLDQVGLFNESLSGAADYDLWLRIASRFPLGYIDEVLAVYRFHESNMSADSFTMTSEDLLVIESIVRDFPNVYKVVGRRKVRQRLGELAYQLAGWYMWKSRDFDLARRHFYKAIKLRPLDFRGYRYLLWCALTPGGRKAIDWYWSRLKNLAVSKTQPPSPHSIN